MATIQFFTITPQSMHIDENGRWRRVEKKHFSWYLIKCTLVNAIEVELMQAYA